VLLRYLSQTNLSLVTLAKKLQHDVSALAATANHPQTPAYYDQLNGDFTILGRPIEGVASPGEGTEIIAAESGLDSPTLTPTQRSLSLKVAVAGSQRKLLQALIAGLHQVVLADPRHADIFLDSDSGSLTNSNGQLLFRFGTSKSAALYRAVLEKWLLSEDVTRSGGHMVGTTVSPLRTSYRDGDRIDIDVQANVPGFAVAFDVAADGSIALLEPNSDNLTTLPDRTDSTGHYKLSLQLAPPFGTDHTFVAVAPELPAELIATLRHLNGRAPNPSEFNALRNEMLHILPSLTVVEFHTEAANFR